MIRDMTSLQNYHSVICNTADISGDSAPLVDKATDEKWAHGSKAYDVETAVLYMWDEENETWIAQNVSPIGD